MSKEEFDKLMLCKTTGHEWSGKSHSGEVETFETQRVCVRDTSSFVQRPGSCALGFLFLDLANVHGALTGTQEAMKQYHINATASAHIQRTLPRLAGATGGEA